MKIDHLIAELKAIQVEHGNVDVLMSGFNDTGYVAVEGLSAEDCQHTRHARDGEVVRKHVLQRQPKDRRTDVDDGAPVFKVAVISNGFPTD